MTISQRLDASVLCYRRTKCENKNDNSSVSRWGWTEGADCHSHSDVAGLHDCNRRIGSNESTGQSRKRWAREAGSKQVGRKNSKQSVFIVGSGAPK